jgi:hypothetical protein
VRKNACQRNTAINNVGDTTNQDSTSADCFSVYVFEETVKKTSRSFSRCVLQAGIVLAIGGAAYSPILARAQEPAQLPDSTLGVLTGRNVHVTTVDGLSVDGEFAGFDAKTATILRVDGEVVVIYRAKISAITVVTGEMAVAPAPASASGPVTDPPVPPLADEPEPISEADAEPSPSLLPQIDGDAVAGILLSGRVPAVCARDSSSELCRAHLRKGVESLDARAKEKLLGGVLELVIGAAVGIPATAGLGYVASTTQTAEDICRDSSYLYGTDYSVSCPNSAPGWWAGTVAAGLATGILVVAGIVHLGQGSNAKNAANKTRLAYRLSLTPTHSRRFTGVSLTGRF